MRRSTVAGLVLCANGWLLTLASWVFALYPQAWIAEEAGLEPTASPDAVVVAVFSAGGGLLACVAALALVLVGGPSSGRRRWIAVLAGLAALLALARLAQALPLFSG